MESIPGVPCMGAIRCSQHHIRALPSASTPSLPLLALIYTSEILLERHLDWAEARPSQRNDDTACGARGDPGVG